MILDSKTQTYSTLLGSDEVIIGNSKSSVFEPHIQFFKWSKECSLSISAKNLISSTTPTLTADKVEISDSKVGWYANPDPDNSDNLKFGLIFYERPQSNIFQFQLEGNQDLVQIKRPPLVENNLNGTKTFDTSGGLEEHANSQQFFRRVIDGNTVRYEHFLTFLHPKFIDAKGNWIWIDLEIQGSNYIITCPQKFLDNAIYPIKANDSVTYQEGTSSYTGAHDTYIRSDYLTDNWNSAEHNQIYKDASTQVNMLASWDLSALSSVTVSAVTISFLSVDEYSNQETTCHRLLVNWVDTQTTYNIYSTGNNWNTAGGISNNLDRVSTESTNFTMTVIGWQIFPTSAQLVTDVQDMIDNPSTNYGWIFYVTNVGDFKRVCDNENATAASRPKITITYTPSGGGERPCDTEHKFIMVM
jgi:hypothetical protein